MATGIWSWSQTAATNSTADSTINWAEGQAPSSVNDSARALMAIVARWRDDLAGVKPSNAVMLVAGSQNALTLSTNASIAALTNGHTVTFRIDTGLNNTGSCTLNVDSFGAKQLRGVTGSTLPSGYLQVGGTYTATYFQAVDQWLLHNYFGGGTTVTLPGSSTDTALVRWNGAGGATLQDSVVKLSATVLAPTVNDAVALGSTSLMWSDAFLASGAVINFNNGDMTITHSADTLTVAGGDFKAATLYDNTYRVGMVLLTTVTVAAGATISADLSSYTGFRGIVVKLYGCLPATDGAVLYCRFSTDGGSTYIASGYNYSINEIVEGSEFTFGSGSAAQIAMTDVVGSASNEGYNGSIEIMNQSSSAFWPRIIHHGYYIDSGGTPTGVYVDGGGSNETAQDMNGIRFLYSTGNITGTAAIYGLL